MLYVYTSMLVALCTNEAKTANVLNWYANCTEELASAAWCITEFASALGLKQRPGNLPKLRRKLRGFNLNAFMQTTWSCCRLRLRPYTNRPC